MNSLEISPTIIVENNALGAMAGSDLGFWLGKTPDATTEDKAKLAHDTAKGSSIISAQQAERLALAVLRTIVSSSYPTRLPQAATEHHSIRRKTAINLSCQFPNHDRFYAFHRLDSLPATGCKQGRF
ncbi:hypothetical protein [Pantoea sp.]|uniref:hypothetical protein n=1 Tax=Pantoea sp. TaxID=69393 RepID=UPI0028AB8DC5|nr:hypothetical protein [Pantoea sp.]